MGAQSYTEVRPGEQYYLNCTISTKTSGQGGRDKMGRMGDG